MGKVTTEDIIKRANNKHGVGRYNYSETIYVNCKEKVRVICYEKDENGVEHGEFYQRADAHLNGQGCPKCGNNKKGKTLIIPYDDILKRFENIHNKKYDYSNVDYKDTLTKICIICHEKDGNGVEHGEFWQTPEHHLTGRGCPKCADNIKLTTDEWIRRAIKVHGDRYDYSKTIYINAKTKVCITCKKHGDFFINAHNHLMGRGCPKCKNSKLEIKVEKILDNLNIHYTKQKTFGWLMNPNTNRKLILDFYLPDYNIAIECQGLQHFASCINFSGDDGFEKNKYRDKLKFDLCCDNNIKVLYFTDVRGKGRIPKEYYSDIIRTEKKLVNILKIISYETK